MKKIIIVFALLMIALSVSVSVSAFSFKLPWQKTAEPIITTEKQINQEVVAEDKNLIDADEAITMINSNSYADYIKHFAGDNFCIITEDREIYATVNTEGKIEQLNYKPSCYKIKTTEDTLNKVSEIYKKDKQLSDEQFKKMFSLPLGLKIKILRVAIIGS